MNNKDISNIIQELLTHAGFVVHGIEDTIDEHDGSYWFAIRTDNPTLLIGKNGEHLQAVNMLVRKIIEAKAPENTLRFVIDVGGFQKQKVDNVKAIAHMMAERARFFKSSVAIDPMSAFERRIVHEFLKDKQDLQTGSEGEGAGRHVVIKYVGTLT